MSGYKRATISIGQDEYNRLREAESKLRSLPEPNHESQLRIQEHSLGLLQSSLQEMKSRESEYLTMLSGMDDHIRHLESSTNARFYEYQQSTAEQIELYTGSLWRYYDQILDDQEKRYNEYVITINQQHQHQIAEYINQLNYYHSINENKRAIAETWQAMVEEQFYYVSENYAHDFFMPGTCDRIEDQINLARNNVDLGMYEAAVSYFQVLYTTITDTRLTLENKHREWNILFQASFEAINQLHTLIQQSSFVQALDLEGNELSSLVDVNYWTQDELSSLQAEVQHLSEELFNAENPPVHGQLIEWLDITFPMIYQKAEELILDARVKAINSQLRINVADLVVQALNEQGFTLSDAAYQSNDVREGFGAQLCNLEGNEVIVHVSPTGQNIGENELQIQSLDSEEKTEHELRSRWVEISKSLAGYGLEVGPYVQADTSNYSNKPQIRIPPRTKITRLPVQAR